jgi:ketol-acid reductoisomerase
MKTIDISVIGKHYSSSTNVSNIDLIQVNDSIRNHPIEKIGKSLRSAMTAMKVIKTDVEQVTVLS